MGLDRVRGIGKRGGVDLPLEELSSIDSFRGFSRRDECVVKSPTNRRASFDCPRVVEYHPYHYNAHEFKMTGRKCPSNLKTPPRMNPDFSLPLYHEPSKVAAATFEQFLSTDYLDLKAIQRSLIVNQKTVENQQKEDSHFSDSRERNLREYPVVKNVATQSELSQNFPSLCPTDEPSEEIKKISTASQTVDHTKQTPPETVQVAAFSIVRDMSESLGTFGNIAEMSLETVGYLMELLQTRRSSLLQQEPSQGDETLEENSGGEKADIVKRFGAPPIQEVHRKELRIFLPPTPSIVEVSEEASNNQLSPACHRSSEASHSFESLVALETHLEAQHQQLMKDGYLDKGKRATLKRAQSFSASIEKEMGLNLNIVQDDEEMNPPTLEEVLNASYQSFFSTPTREPTEKMSDGAHVSFRFISQKVDAFDDHGKQGSIATK